MYVDARINWMRNNETLKFTTAHTNAILVETWEDFKISSASMSHDAFNKTHLPPLYPPDQDMNIQYFLAGTQI